MRRNQGREGTDGSASGSVLLVAGSLVRDTVPAEVRP
jgi:hypothetical protein